jgi:ABC-type uncharacterized transport system permease subunit
LAPWPGSRPSTGELWLGIADAAAAGVGFGLLMGLLTVSLGLS